MAHITLYPLSMMLWLTAPFWIPVAIGSYAVGKQKVSLRFIFAAVTIEAIAIGVCWSKWFLDQLWP